VAYISYNAYPGNHFRDLVRGMMRYHSAHFAEPDEQVRQGRALLKFLADSKEPRDLYHQLLAREFDRLENYTEAAAFHDDFSPENRSFYFHEFIAQATSHGLQFLAEADMAENVPRSYPPNVEAILANLDPTDVVAREQYLDFLRCRPFRQTLLCHREQQRPSEPLPERARRLRVAGDIRPVASTTDPRSRAPEIFRSPNGSEIETDEPLVKAALTHLGSIWPECITFEELLAHGASVGAALSPDDVDSLAIALIRTYAAGFLQLRAHRPPLTSRPGARPQASTLTRLQLRTGDRVTSLLHTVVLIDDPLGQALVTLLDGTRDRAMLETELASVPNPSGQPVTGEALEASLRGLARRALLCECE
jgi:methyltransferase-like protein